MPHWLSVILVGCATAPAPELPRTERPFPADGLVTQRAILTIRGRQFSFNGYLALSRGRGQRLLVTGNFGNVLADLLVKPDGRVHVMRSSSALRPHWIKRYVAEDLQCIFGNAPEGNCPGKMLTPNHFIIQRPRYSLDLQIVEVTPGPQPAQLFDETVKGTP